MPNRSLSLALTKRLRESSRADRRHPVVVLGVGSELRSDDAAGLRVAAQVSRFRLRRVRGLEGGMAPENLTGAIRELAPSHLVVVDAADMGEPPGTVRFVDPREIRESAVGTHGLPLSVLSDYLEHETGCGVTILGIQPACLEPGSGLSPVVEAAVRRVTRAIGRAGRSVMSARGTTDPP